MNISTIYHLFQQHPVVTTDSRNCPEGSLFFALKGSSFNGNAYAANALKEGCAYAIIDDPQYADPSNDRLIQVDDVLTTLQQLANYHRRQLGTRIIGVTGTNGKTTTKELIAAVLSKKYKVLYTEGNFNNHIGVPLTLLRLRPEHEIAVIEMGANHPGEIKTLVNIVEPNYGLITNVGMAHLEGFGSFEGVIRTKGELYDFFRTRPDSTVFIHNDNPHLKKISEGLNLIRYGREASGEVLSANGEVLECAPYMKFRWRISNTEWHTVQSHLIGDYNLDNMLAAAAIGHFFGLSETLIDEALSEYQPKNNRSQLKETAHNHLIIDAYNANPTSMQAALHNFRLMSVSPKMVILGAMKELGAASAEEHQKVVDFLLTTDWQKIWLVGPEFQATQHGTLPVFQDVEVVKQAIQAEQPTGFYLLIKGSNSMKLSQLPEYL
jgi:UDP-N-acetylmuramoyl-tripeptide--D-alanyl-D-alanine ligase